MAAGTFIVYLRVGCSLCDAMLDELEPYQGRPGFRLEIVDVDSSPELVALYGAKVPVLMGPEGEVSHYFLDPEALERALPPR